MVIVVVMGLTLAAPGVRGNLSLDSIGQYVAEDYHLSLGLLRWKSFFRVITKVRGGAKAEASGIKSRLMSELESPTREGQLKAADDAPMFGSRPAEQGGLPMTVWGVAALIVVVMVGVLVFTEHKKPAPAPNTLQPAAAYAVSLPLSQLAMSESTGLSGDRVTYLDGHVRNTGSSTVAAAIVQVVFQNDEALPPQIDTVPLTLIRTRQPYVDTEPMSAEPLKPGDEREFRLIFEAVPENWNTQMPEVRVIQTSLR